MAQRRCSICGEPANIYGVGLWLCERHFEIYREYMDQLQHWVKGPPPDWPPEDESPEDEQEPPRRRR